MKWITETCPIQYRGVELRVVANHDVSPTHSPDTVEIHGIYHKDENITEIFSDTQYDEIAGIVLCQLRDEWAIDATRRIAA